MNVSLKVSKSAYEDIMIGEKNYICHGYSKNKKYQRLFENKIDIISLFCSEYSEKIDVLFKKIEIENNPKKIIKITFNL